MDILPDSEWAFWNTSFGGSGTGSGTLSGPWYRTHKTQLLGVVLAAAANFLISVSLNIQKCAHLRLACEAEPKPYYMSRLWWCGITLLGLGEVGNFTAYGFAPISLVAPLGCVSVIGSAFISVLFLKKTMRAADILGGTLAVTGTYLLVTFAPNTPQELTARRVQNYLVSWPFLVYLILEIIIFCILLYFYKRKAVKHIVVLLMMVALLGAKCESSQHSAPSREPGSIGRPHLSCSSASYPAMRSVRHCTLLSNEQGQTSRHITGSLKIPRWASALDCCSSGQNHCLKQGQHVAPGHLGHLAV
nr:NIPA-like protein 2 isoform X2 [Columba livia]